MWSCGTAAAPRSGRLVTRRLVLLPGLCSVWVCVKQGAGWFYKYVGSVSVFSGLAWLHISSVCPLQAQAARCWLWPHYITTGVMDYYRDCVYVCVWDLRAALTRLQGLEMWLQHGPALITVITYCWILYILYYVLHLAIGCLGTTHTHVRLLLWLN